MHDFLASALIERSSWVTPGASGGSPFDLESVQNFTLAESFGIPRDIFIEFPGVFHSANKKCLDFAPWDLTCPALMGTSSSQDQQISK